MYMHQWRQGIAGNMVDIPSTYKQVFFKFTSVFLSLFLKGKNHVLSQWWTDTISTEMKFVGGGRQGAGTRFGL